MGPVPEPKKELLYGIPPDHRKSSNFKRHSCSYWTVFALTSSGCITKLLADHTGINTAPTIITHSPPLVIDAQLNSTFILVGASHKTDITISAATIDICYRNEHTLCSLIAFYIFCFRITIRSNAISTYSSKPWHRTPAYDLTEEQLTVELWGQSVRLVSLPVHSTSSRCTVRVPELAPKWELRKATASVKICI